MLPVQALDKVKPPILPLPKGLEGVQAIHGEDLGEAYALAAIHRVPGAFNICADDILTPQNLADIVGHGRYVHLPAGLVRATLAGSHKTGVVPMDEGWIDMGLSVPMVDNSNAKQHLGWEPKHSAADALRDLLTGMIKGQGGDSVPLRPRDRDYSTVPGTDMPVGEGGTEGTAESSDDSSLQADAPQGEFGRGASNISDKISTDLLNLYLSDHLTGATGGLERVERMEEDFVDTPVYKQISEVADKIRREHALLQQIIHDLGMTQKHYRQAVAWVGEHAGRLKFNRRVTSRSPMTLVLEAELMRSAVIGKLGGWQVLHDNAEDLSLDPNVFAELQEQAYEQIKVLDEVHEYARKRAFRKDMPTFNPQSPSSEQE